MLANFFFFFLSFVSDNLTDKCRRDRSTDRRRRRAPLRPRCPPIVRRLSRVLYLPTYILYRYVYLYSIYYTCVYNVVMRKYARDVRVVRVGVHGHLTAGTRLRCFSGAAIFPADTVYIGF